MISTVFFDWGGVLADDPGDDFLSALLRDLGASDSQIQEIHATYMRRFMRGELTEQEYWQALRDSYSFRIPNNLSSRFLDWSGLVVNEDIRQLVLDVRSRGIQTALLSNVIEPTYTALEQAGCYAMFDVLIASCKVGYAKPQPKIYQIALEQANAVAAESLFIDDKQPNLDPAAAIGITTILATSPEQIIRDTMALGAKVEP